MGGLLRFGVSMDAELLTAFDDLIERKGYANRSEAFRDLVRGTIIESRVADAETITPAAFCFEYNRDAADLPAKVSELQQEFNSIVVSSMRVPCGDSSGMEVIVLRGRAGDLRTFADRVLALRGVTYGKLMLMGSDGSDTDPRH